jgi:hypothetical protein
MKKKVGNNFRLYWLNFRIVVQAILDLGNDILKNLGVEEKIEDVGVFFR